MRDYRLLMEWLYANGNKVNNSKPIVATNRNSKADFTEKFKKLYTHIKDVHGGLNVMRCAMHTLEVYYGDYYDRNSPWHHLIIRYIPAEGCFEINLTERGTGVLIYAGEADSWVELLDILMQTETINNRKLCEWVVASKVDKSSSNNAANSTTNEVVYIWDMYIDLRDKGTWCSAEKYHGEYDGYVYETHYAANVGAHEHLFELRDSGDLIGKPIDYKIDVHAIPKSEVSDYTLQFSGL